MTRDANDSGSVPSSTAWEMCDTLDHRRGDRSDKYWVLGGTKRDFYICATARRRDWRTALCVFDSEEAAEEHLRSLGDAQLFLDTLERYGASMPDWMRRDPLLPEVEEVLTRDLRHILESLGVEYVTVNPPPAGERTETLELLPASNFAA